MGNQDFRVLRNKIIKALAFSKRFVAIEPRVEKISDFQEKNSPLKQKIVNF